jgi:hypothetical protein
MNTKTRVCPTCSVFDEIRFQELGTCPTCGSNLQQRVEARDRMKFRRSQSHIAHPYELSYGDTPILDVGIHLRHEKLDVILYTHGLIRATSVVMEWAQNESDFGIGFLTGSAALMWLLRELYPGRLADRIRYVPGLAHTGQDSERHLRSTLNDSLARGMRRLFIVDEVISGTQLHTNARAIERWARDFHSTHSFEVLLIGPATCAIHRLL